MWCEMIHTTIWNSRQETAAKQLSQHMAMAILTLPANISGYMLSYKLCWENDTVNVTQWISESIGQL
jgi:hypothetical protein